MSHGVRIWKSFISQSFMCWKLGPQGNGIDVLEPLGEIFRSWGATHSQAMKVQDSLVPTRADSYKVVNLALPPSCSSSPANDFSLTQALHYEVLPAADAGIFQNCELTNHLTS